MALFASGILPPTYCAILHSSFRGIFQMILPSAKTTIFNGTATSIEH